MEVDKLISAFMVYWGGKVIEVRNKIRAWRESDKSRYTAKLK